MTERDLENLSKVPVPQPGAHAKRSAIDAALAAFDAAQSARTETDASSHSDVTIVATTAAAAASETARRSQTSQAEPQGTVHPLRPTETTHKRSFRMNISSRQGQALAASLAALIVAAPLTFHYLHQTTLERMSGGEATVEGTLHKAPKQAPLPQQTETGGRVVAREPSPMPSPPPALAARSADAKPDAIARSAPAGAAQNPADIRAEDGAVMMDREQSKDVAIAGTPAPVARHDSSQSAQNQAQANAPASEAAGHARLQEVPAASSIAALPPPPPQAPPVVAQLTKPAAPAALNARRVMEKKKAEDLGWMGRDADLRDQRFVDDENRDKFETTDISPIKQVAQEPVSTFSLDVDTASYAFVRRALNAGHLPPKGAVRVEEMINYFPYGYAAPDTPLVPFKPTVTVVPSPWNAHNALVHVAVKGYELKSAERPRANLVFLVDVSGSMAPDDRLPLIKNALRLLVEDLQSEDTIALVTYASGSGIALEPTKVADKSRILRAIDTLGAGGATAGAAGLEDAYRLAEQNFDKSAVNRIVLATDGDFNVGITDQTALKGLIERKRQSGIFLSILGVGQGNHNDALMQTLAQNGNGTAAYIDTLSEARKVLVEEASSTLFTIAKDVKVQIEWNPQRVAEYRLIGYETRNLKREDFNNDRVDAGDIGSGHTVTAIYEVTPVGAPKLVDDLRYGAKSSGAAEAPAPAATAAGSPSELGFLKLRYKRPREETSNLIELPIPAPAAMSGDRRALAEASGDVRFSIAVAGFGQLLRGEPYTGSFSYDDVLTLAQSARGDDPFGYRGEFLSLVRLAKSARP